MTGMSEEQIIEHLKELFLQKIEPQLLEISDTDIAIAKG